MKPSQAQHYSPLVRHYTHTECEWQTHTHTHRAPVAFIMGINNMVVPNINTHLNTAADII